MKQSCEADLERIAFVCCMLEAAQKTAPMAAPNVPAVVCPAVARSQAAAAIVVGKNGTVAQPAGVPVFWSGEMPHVSVGSMAAPSISTISPRCAK